MQPDIAGNNYETNSELSIIIAIPIILLSGFKKYEKR